MKTLLKTITMLMLFLAIGCEKPEANDNSEGNSGSNDKTEVEIFFGLNKESISINPEGGSVDIIVYSNHKWELKGGSDWCIPSITSGEANENGEKVTFSAELTYDDRETIYWFCCGDQKITFVVTQQLMEVIIPDTNNTFDIPAEGGIACLKYQTNVKCKVVIPETDKDWISLSSENTKGLAEDSIKLSIKENSTYSTRTSTVKIVIEDNESVYSEYIIRQEQNDGLISDNNIIVVSSLGGNVNLTYKTNVECKVIIPKEAQNWISTSSDTKGLNPQSISLQIAENGDYESRSTIVRVVAISNEDLSIEYTINQEQKDAIIGNETNTYNLPSTGGNITINYQTNVECEVAIPEGAKKWISIVPNTRSLTDKSITLAISENTTYSARSAVIQVIKVGDNKTAIEYTINQEQNNAFFPGEQTCFNIGGWDTTVDIKYQTNVECKITIPEEAKDWVQLAPQTRSLSNESISLNIAANHTGAERTTSVKVTALCDESLSAEYIIIQNPRYYLQYTSNNRDIVSVYSSYAFNANIVNNSYSEEFGGYIDFDAPINKIGDSAFKGRTKLESIIIPETVTSIGDNAFSECSSLKSVELSNGVTSIGIGAFYGCTNLENINLSNNILKIGEQAFCLCSSLKQINIPQGITIIEKQTFSGCSSLEVAPIPESVTEIRKEAFNGCVNLKEVVISENVTKIEAWVFTGCTGKLTIKSKIVENNLSTTVYRNFQDTQFTELIIGDNITKIGSYQFEKNKFKTVTIPNGVTSIGNASFTSSSNLTSIEIPSSVTSIGKEAFRGCGSLVEVYLPNSITSIGEAAFQSCSNLTSITYPDGMSSIVEKIFSGCKSLKTFTIPSSVKSIGRESFYGCSSLEDIIIPNNVTSIGYQAFWGCNTFKNLFIPYNVTSIGAEAFKGVSGTLTVNSKIIEKGYDSMTIKNHWLIGSNFSNIIIGEDVKQIGYMALSNVNCEKVTIPNSITSIGAHAFSGCTLKSINLPNSITSISNNAFYSCQSLESITIPNSVSNIPSETFRFCYALEEVNIPDNITSIGANAFKRCIKLKKVSIGKGVKSIGAYAFEECTMLTDVYCKAITPPTFSTYNTFDTNIADRTFYVPTESLEKYKTSWGAYNIDINSFEGYEFD